MYSWKARKLFGMVGEGEWGVVGGGDYARWHGYCGSGAHGEDHVVHEGNWQQAREAEKEGKTPYTGGKSPATSVKIP
jgi:hypothetical protein